MITKVREHISARWKNDGLWLDFEAAAAQVVRMLERGALVIAWNRMPGEQ